MMSDGIGTELTMNIQKQNNNNKNNTPADFLYGQKFIIFFLLSVFWFGSEFLLIEDDRSLQTRPNDNFLKNIELILSKLLSVSRTHKSHFSPPHVFLIFNTHTDETQHI